MSKPVIYIPSCGFLEGRAWEIVPEGPSLVDELAEALELMTAHAAMFNRDTDEMWVARRNHAEAALAKYKEQKQ